jgi:hypothetical protein
MLRRARAALLESVAPGSAEECGEPDGVPLFTVGAAGGTGAPTTVREPRAGPDGVGSAALRSPLRTRSAAGGSADLPADSASRRSIEAARPPVAWTARGVAAAVFAADGAAAAGGRAALASGGALATGAETAGSEPRAGVDADGSAALRSPLRTRSAAGGSADLPADSASRRSIEAARPLVARDAGG